MQLSRYLKIYPCPDRPGRNILYSTKRSAIVQLSDAALQAARDGSLASPERDTLSRLGFLVADPAAERAEMRDLFANDNRTRNLFSAVAVLNLDCNLACTYCYEDRFRGSHYMSQEIANLLVATTRQRIEQGRNIKLSFYGGEPLLSRDLIRDISIPLQQAAQEQGVAYSFSLVTNGTLLSRSVVEELLPLGLSGAKVTLDGPAELHNQSRPFASGRGSFDAIVKNVIAIHDILPLQLGGNFTRDNYRRFPELLDLLLDQGLAPHKLHSFLCAPVIPKSGERVLKDFNTDCACSYEPWLNEAALFLREEGLKRGFPAPKMKVSGCMVEFDDDLVINYDGSLYKCPAFMAYDQLRIGTLADGIGDYRVSHNMDVWKKDECLDCAYLPLCFGGCRQMTLLRNGAIDDVDCRKDLFDATLEGIIRQDMQYQATKKK